MSRDRAVSEVVGFILVFSLITTTVSVVYVVGFQGLTEARDAERINNAERAFDVLAHNVEDIDRDGAPGRSTEVKLADAQLSFGEETTVEWCWNPGGAPPTNCDGLSTTNNVTVRPIVFETDGTHIVYENGAVIRAQGDGAVVRREPGVVFREDSRSVVIPVVDMNAQGSTSVGGDTTVLVRTQLQSGQGGRSWLAPSPTTTPTGFRFTVDTAPNRAQAWERYLEDKVTWKSDACSVSDSANGVVACEFTADRAVFRVVRIDARFA